MIDKLLDKTRSVLKNKSNKLSKSIVKRLNKKLEKHDKERYEKLPFTSLDELISTKYSEEQFEYAQNNMWYQNGLAIKTYAGFSKTFKLPVSIEHGVKYNDYITPYEVDNDLPGIFTSGQFRINIHKTKGTNKEVFAIGPFIKYAKPILTESEFQKEKQKLGKMLLVIPLHSDCYCEIEHNDNAYFNRIKEIAKDFDTVRVCLHWYDIENNRYDQYKEMGWECVTAGHESSHLFLSRLRSIIELSDAVISDGVGTHVGFSLALNKPICLHKVKFELKNIANLPHITDELLWASTENEVFDKFFELFSSYPDKISQEQLEGVEYYYGLNLTKSKEEIREIILKQEGKYKKQP